MRIQLFMYTDKNNDKNKTILPHLPLHSIYSFLNCWKATKPMTLKFLDFRFLLITCFVENLDYFALQFVGGGQKKNIFFLI